MKTRTREVGFQVLSGSADTLKASLEAGASGAVLALAGCAPQACLEIYAAWKEKDAGVGRRETAADRCGIQTSGG